MDDLLGEVLSPDDQKNRRKEFSFGGRIEFGECLLVLVGGDPIQQTLELFRYLKSVTMFLTRWVQRFVSR